MLLLSRFGKYKSFRINTVEEYEGFNNFANFKVSSKEGALLLNEIIEKYNIVPHITEYMDECLELLHPSCMIYTVNDNDILNPRLNKFNVVMWCSSISADSCMMTLILGVNPQILEKIDSLKIYITKSSQINNLSYLSKAMFIIQNVFELDEEIKVDKIGNLTIRYKDDKTIETLLNQIKSINYLSTPNWNVKLILPEYKITSLHISESILLDNLMLSAQNIADNKYIKCLITPDILKANFEDNYTLLEYSGFQPSIIKIVERNQELLEKSRFTRTKPIMDH